MIGAVAVDVDYRVNAPLRIADVARVFTASGINRPADDLPRLERMFAAANLVVSAWRDGRLVGVARALTDHSYCCYLSDLAVDRRHQRQGIGRGLVATLRGQLSEEVTLVLVSAPDARSFYPPLGFAPATDAFIIRRRR